MTQKVNLWFSHDPFNFQQFNLRKLYQIAGRVFASLEWTYTNKLFIQESNKEKSEFVVDNTTKETKDVLLNFEGFRICFLFMQEINNQQWLLWSWSN